MEREEKTTQGVFRFEFFEKRRDGVVESFRGKNLGG